MSNALRLVLISTLLLAAICVAQSTSHHTHHKKHQKKPIIQRRMPTPVRRTTPAIRRQTPAPAPAPTTTTTHPTAPAPAPATAPTTATTTTAAQPRVAGTTTTTRPAAKTPRTTRSGHVRTNTYWGGYRSSYPYYYSSWPYWRSHYSYIHHIPVDHELYHLRHDLSPIHHDLLSSPKAHKSINLDGVKKSTVLVNRGEHFELKWRGQRSTGLVWVLANRDNVIQRGHVHPINTDSLGHGEYAHRFGLISKIGGKGEVTFKFRADQLKAGSEKLIFVYHSPASKRLVDYKVVHVEVRH